MVSQDSGYVSAMLTFVLLLIGFICFVLATIGVPVPRVNLVALGLACWIFTALLGSFPGS